MRAPQRKISPMIWCPSLLVAALVAVGPARPAHFAVRGQLWVSEPRDRSALVDPGAFAGLDRSGPAFAVVPGDLTAPNLAAGPRATPTPDVPADPFAALGLRADGVRLRYGQKAEVDQFQWNAKAVLADPNIGQVMPGLGRAWQMEESLRLPVFGPLFWVGHVESRSDSAEAQLYRVETKAGFGAQVPFLPGGEVQFRGGQRHTNTDPDSLSVVPGPNQTRLVVEVLARCRLAGPMQLEYTGSALSALTPTGRDLYKQDVRVALPFSDSGQFHIGAKYRWENDPAQTTLGDRMQLYLGLQLKH